MAQESRRRQSMSVSYADPPVRNNQAQQQTNTQPSPVSAPAQSTTNGPPGRASPSKTRRYLREAVSTVFDQNAPPEQSSAVHPDLVAAITREVIQNLKLSGLGGLQPAEPPAQSHPPPRDVYTPPSPERYESVVPPPNQLDGLNERNGDARYLEKSSESQTKDSDTETLEKIWQPLFDENGEPTLRLGQFLRGLAIHIIEDYEPCNSIVIGPQKMIKFYDETKVNEELYPWKAIFGGKMTMSSISHLYRDLNCQHHFVQNRFDEKPCVPSLTALGFEAWMTHAIRAHPDKEFDRFAKAVMAMPVSNADNRQERFPKRLPRKLFPSHMNQKVFELFEDSILADPVIELPRRSSVLPPPQQPNNLSHSTPTLPTSPPKQPPPPPTYAPSVERERKPYSGASSDAAGDEAPPPVSIERERKPYYAQPGQGKNYESDDASCLKPDGSYPTRSSTASSASRAPPDGPEENTGRSRRNRSGSQAAFHAPPRRKARSPSTSGHTHAYSRSEADVAPPASFTSAGSTLQPEHEDGLQKTYSRDSRRYVPEDGGRSYAPTPQQQVYEAPDYSRPPPRQNSVQSNYPSQQPYEAPDFSRPPPRQSSIQPQQPQQPPHRY
ncbi:MAG: hypothetical protein M1828_005678 [Chrysothrix sp. TS-e1954]|nr:MAG: hypothetical protein M1828_005678 [Chrysothrix sp. TS-e1954]